MSTPTAGWPANTLVASLSRAGWGDLAPRTYQGARDVLAALANLLPHRAGQGTVTVAQIADAAGRTPKWTAHCLRVLEGLGIIESRRGGIRAGRPVAGWVRINKARLVALIAGARAELVDRRARRAEATAERIATYRLSDTVGRRRRRHPLSRHMEVSSPPTPLTGGVSRPAAPRPKITTKEEPEMVRECVHGLPLRSADGMPSACGMCAREIRKHPTMDVRQLWADDTPPATPATVSARVAAIKAVLRAGRGPVQDALL